jgi:group I intron endonuclease
MIGVYSITNSVTGKIYIGSTTVDFENRWKSHKMELTNNRHGNQILQDDWNKYGGNAFIFEIVEIVKGKKEALKTEQEWLNKLYGENCYNIQSIVPISRKFRSGEDRITTSEAKKLVKFVHNYAYWLETAYYHFFRLHPSEVPEYMKKEWDIDISLDNVLEIIGRDQ